MSRTAWLGSAAAACIVAALSATPASAVEPARSSCAPRAMIVQHLATQNKEQPMAVGQAEHGSRLELFTSPDGTWTLLFTLSNGMSCLLNAGTDWQTVPRIAAANTTD